MHFAPAFNDLFLAARRAAVAGLKQEAASDAAWQPQQPQQQHDRAALSEPGVCARIQSAPYKRSPPFSGDSAAHEADGAWAALPAAKRRNAVSAGGGDGGGGALLAAYPSYDIQAPALVGPSRMMITAVDGGNDYHPAGPQTLDETVVKTATNTRKPTAPPPPRWSTGLDVAGFAPGAAVMGPPRLRQPCGRPSPVVSAASDEPCSSSHFIASSVAFLGPRNRTSAGSHQQLGPPAPHQTGGPAHHHAEHPLSGDTAAAAAAIPVDELATAVWQGCSSAWAAPVPALDAATPGGAMASPAGGGRGRAGRQRGARASAMAAAAAGSPREASAGAIPVLSPAAADTAAAPGATAAATSVSPSVSAADLDSDPAVCLSIMAQSPSKGGPDLLEKMRIAEALLTHRDKLGPQLVQLVIQQLAALCQSASVDELVARMAAQAPAAAAAAAAAMRPEASAGISRSNSGSATRERAKPEPAAATTTTAAPCVPGPAPTARAVAPERGADPAAASTPRAEDVAEHGGSTSSSSSSSRTATHATEPRAAAAATGSTMTGPSVRSQPGAGAGSAAATAGARTAGGGRSRGGRRGAATDTAATAAAAVSLDPPSCPDQASQGACGELTSMPPPPPPVMVVAATGPAKGHFNGVPHDAGAELRAATAAAAAAASPRPGPAASPLVLDPAALLGGGLRLEGPLDPALLPRHLQQQLLRQAHQLRVAALSEDQEAPLQPPLYEQWGSAGGEEAPPPRRQAGSKCHAPAGRPAVYGGGDGFVALPATPAAAAQQLQLELELEQVQRGEVVDAGDSVLNLTAGVAAAGTWPSATTTALIAALAQRAKSIVGMLPADVDGLAGVLAAAQQQQQQGTPPFPGQQLRGAGALLPQQPLRHRPVHASEDGGSDGGYGMDWEWAAGREVGDMGCSVLPPPQQQRQLMPPCGTASGAVPTSTTAVARRALAAALAAKAAAAGPAGGGFAWVAGIDGGDEEYAAVADAMAQAARAQRATLTAVAPPARLMGGRVRDAAGPGLGWTASSAAAAMASRGRSGGSVLGDAHRCSGGSGLPLSPDAYVTLRLAESALPAGPAAGKAAAAYGMS